MHLHIEPSVLYFGTPVALITTLDDDGDTNITPISSAWALGRTYVLGIGDDSHGLANLRRDPGIVINLPEASLAHRVEAIAATTGAAALSPRKAGAYRTEKDKWGLGGFTPSPAELVGPMRIVECPVQIEARVERIVPCDDDASAVHARVLRIHAREDVVVPGTHHVDLRTWRPLLYTFRHYFAQGEEVAQSFRAEY